MRLNQLSNDVFLPGLSSLVYSEALHGYASVHGRNSRESLGKRRLDLPEQLREVRVSFPTSIELESDSSG